MKKVWTSSTTLISSHITNSYCPLSTVITSSIVVDHTLAIDWWLLLVIEHCHQSLLATICSLLLPSLIIWRCCHIPHSFSSHNCHYWWNFQLNQKLTKLFFRLCLKKYKTTLSYTKKIWRNFTFLPCTLGMVQIKPWIFFFFFLYKIEILL